MSRGTLLVCTLLCAVATVGLAVFAVAADAALWERALCGGAALGTAALTIAVLPHLRRREGLAVVRVLDEGIEHRTAGLLTWEELERVGFYRALGQRLLGIWTRDPDLVASRTGARGARLWARVCRPFGWPALSYAPPTVDTDDLYAEIAARRPELVSERAP
jgi:hypothetical protein